MNETRTPGTTTAPLIPIPRTGLRGSAGIILYILITLSAATVGIGVCALRGVSTLWVNIAEILSGVTLVLLIIHLFRVSRRIKGLMPVLIILSVFIVYISESLIPAAILLSLLFAIGEGAVLLAVTPKKQLLWFPLVPVAAFVLSAAFSRDLVGAAAALFPFPAMMILAAGTRNSAAREDGLTRVGVLCATSAACAVSLLLLAALWLYTALGSLTPAVLTEALESLRSAAIESIMNLDVPPELSELISQESAENMINSVINLLPAYLVVALNLLATVAQFIQHAGLVTFGFGESVTDRVRLFRMSLISCLVFTVAYVIVIFTGTERSTLAGTVAQNVYLILLPGLAFAGMLRLLGSLTRRGTRGMGCLFYLIVFVPLLFFIAPVILAIVEVIGHIGSLILSRLTPPKDDSDPFDGE